MPPQIDADHQGPVINLAAWITLVPMVLFVVAKVFTKWRMIRVLQLDDAYMVIGTVVAIAQTVNTVFQVNSGLGQHEKGLTAEQFDVYQKTTYISQLFYVTVIAFAKLASIQFLMTLTWATGAILVVKGIFGTVAIWLLTSIFVIAFQCKSPFTWNQATGQCLNQPAFWTVNAVVDVITQLLISFIPIYLLFNLKMKKNRKFAAMLAFMPNLATIPLTLIRLIYLFHASYSPSSRADLPFTTFTTALISEIHINCSIIASCIPFMRPLVESLTIGLMTNEIRVPAEEYTNSGSNERSFTRTMTPFGLLSDRRNGYGWTRTQGVEMGKGYSGGVLSGKKKRGCEEVELAPRYGSSEGIVVNQAKGLEVMAEQLRLSLE